MEVSINNIRKEFDRFAALNDVSLKIASGELIALLGPSGSGKTTLLRLIAGLDFPTDGQIFFGAEDASHHSVQDRNVGFVFQHYALFRHMTVAENIGFGLKVRPSASRPSKTEIRKRVSDLLDMVQLSGLEKRYPNQLSGGQRQRVALGRAIVRQPKVFLFDEPLSNLDAQLRVQMRAEISRLHSQLKTTMVYVTHDQVEAMTMGTRIVVMKGGDVQQVGAPLELYNKPANRFVAGFIGTPQMNFLEATIEGSADAPLLVTETLRLPLHGKIATAIGGLKEKRCTLGIRPSDLHIVGTPGAGPVTFDALIDMVEILGAVQVVHIRLGEQTMRAELSIRVACKPGQTIRLAAEPEAFHIFDATSGVAIVGGGEE